MNRRVNTVACALVVGALVVPASQAADQRAPVKRHQLVAHVRSSAFAGLGHEGSALLKAESGTSAFANLGIEGSALAANVGSRLHPAVGAVTRASGAAPRRWRRSDPPSHPRARRQMSHSPLGVLLSMAWAASRGGRRARAGGRGSRSRSL